MSIFKEIRGPAGIVLFGVCVVSIAVAGFLHFNPVCGEEIGVEKTSPDGSYVATLMTRNCGATTPYVAHINLRPATSNFRADFFAGVINEGEVFASSKYSCSRFCWSKPHKLSIGYSELNVRNWRDVVIDDDFRNPACE